VFTQLLLADEINRAPAKTQSALLEAMQDLSVTADGQTRPLPEAQLDRFMFMTLVRYPTPQEETQIMKQATSEYRPQLSRLLDGAKIQQLQQVVRRVPVAEHVFTYARDLVRATRPGELGVPQYDNELVLGGAGPRASIYLIWAGKARAILHGRVHVTTDDIAAMAHPVLRHRILTTFSAEAAGMNSDKVIDRLIAEVPRNRAAA
jgi:MoxR-like ATPase